MTRYLALLRFTEQGIRNIQDSEKRAAEFRDAVAAAGGSVLAQYWAIGEYDGCVVFESPQEETSAALLLKLGQEGNVRTHSLRLFDGQEFTSIIAEM
ncbi:MAG: GYD domain-containing protein [Pirellulaceae bacterium]